MFNILTLCTGNSARSIMAEAIFNRFGSGRVKAYSAGSHHKGRIHPMAIDLLQSKGYDTSSLRSKSWDEFAEHDAPHMDIVITVCDQAENETCPVWPGHPVQGHWGVPDPDRPDLTDEERQQLFEAAYSRLEHRVRQFISLNFEKLDEEELHQNLKEIAGS